VGDRLFWFQLTRRRKLLNCSVTSVPFSGEMMKKKSACNVSSASYLPQSGESGSNSRTSSN